MKKALLKITSLGLLGGALLLAGCGGGGGGESGFTEPSIPRTPVSLDANNAETVASEAYAAIEGTQNTASFVPLGVVIDGPSSGAKVNLKNIVSDAIRDVIARGPSATNGTALGVVVNESEACAYYDFNSNTEVPSGSISISGNVADPNAVSDAGGMWSNGDSATISFNSCAMGFQDWELNGKIDMVVNADFDPSAVEDPSQCIGISGCNADLSIIITNLVFTIGQASLTMHGSYDLAWNIMPTSWTETLSGDSLYLVVSGGGQSAAMEISDFNIDTIADFSNETYSVNGTATLASTVVNGSVTIDAAYGGDITVYYDSETGYIDDVDVDDPTTGTITVTGNNSSISISSQLGSVTIEVDENGDDIFDGAPIVTDWYAL